MNYNVKIIDTQDSTHITKLERAKGSSVVLEWMGGDEKDNLFIVGSRLSLTMVGMSRDDGQYFDLFTGEETRYRVTIEDDNEALVWQGFLLPDSYSEPYTNSPILVDFVATDGLGRLKGKYLPDDFYSEEKSVIQILAQCLRLTGLELSFRFAPAIENSQEKDYNKIYINTALFQENNKKQDAYQILDDLLKSMLCTLYQADNYYNIEGLNVRNFRVYTAKVYTSSGTLTKTTEITRLKKQVSAIRPTNLTAQPPYGVINVTHKKELLALPETLIKEENDGWVISDGNYSGIYPIEWIQFSEGALSADADTGSVKIYPTPGTGVSGNAQFRSRPYITKNNKYRLSFSFKIEDLWDTEAERESAVNNGWWKDPFYMTVRMTYIDAMGVEKEKYLYANALNQFNNSEEFHLEFDKEGKCTKTFSFISNYSGLLNVSISSIESPFGRIARVLINEASLEEIGQEEGYFREILNPGYTSKKEVELIYGNDKTGMSQAFRLQKLKAKGNSSSITTNIIRVIYRDGFYYAIVNLMIANLIKNNIEDVSSTAGPLNVVDVIYNYLNSDEHAIKLEDPITEGTEITITVYDYNTVTEDRAYWEEWTDVFAKIQRDQYPISVLNVLQNLFKKPVFKIDFTVKNNAKFNDFIGFDFRGDKDFILTNCRWDIDKGFTEIIGIENLYGVEKGVNMPPVVEAGPDKYIEGDTVGLSCEAYDPDGFISSYSWEEITGKNVSYSRGQNNNSTTANSLTDDYYEFRITVTDNDGATASDTFKVYRIKEVGISFSTIKDVTYVENGNDNREVDWKLELSKNIGENALNIQGKVITDMKNADFNMYIYQNGQWIFYHQGLNESSERNFSITYLQGDEIIIETWTNKQNSDSTVDLQIIVEQGDFVEGTGEVSGVPITISNTQ